MRKALRAQSGREGGLDRLRARLARPDPLQRSRRGHADGGGQGAEGSPGARRIRQGARRRRSARPGQGRADPRLHSRRSELGRHVGARRGGRPARRSRQRDGVLSRGVEDRPGRAGHAHQHGTSLALNKQLPEAEKALQQAVASPKADARMRGDLALVLALEGKFAEAEQVGKTDLSRRPRAPTSIRSG